MCQRMPPRFTDSEDDCLLSIVADYPALYDWRHEDSKNPKVKAEIWDSVAHAVGRDVETCKRRWKDIKDNYFKIKRQRKMGKCKWSLVGKLAFLDIVEPERRMVPSMEGDDKEAGPSRESRYDKARFVLPTPEIVITEKEDLDGHDTEDSIHEDPNSRKRRFEVISGEGQASMETEDSSGQGSSWGQEDDVDLFMRSIALQVKRLPPRLVAQAKLKILTTVNELQFGQLQVDVKREPY